MLGRLFYAETAEVGKRKDKKEKKGTTGIPARKGINFPYITTLPTDSTLPYIPL